MKPHPDDLAAVMAERRPRLIATMLMLVAMAKEPK